MLYKIDILLMRCLDSHPFTGYLFSVGFGYPTLIWACVTFRHFGRLFKYCLLPNWLLCRGGRPPTNKCPDYDTKQSNGKVPVMLELWEMQSIHSLPSLPGSLWPQMIAHDMILSMGQIEQNCVLLLNWIAWNRTVLIFKLHTYAKLNRLKWNCFLC